MSKSFIPARAHETDEERRLREAIDRQATQLLHTLDSAIMLRTASGEVSRMRHMARSDLTNFCLKAMNAQAMAAAEK